MATGGVAVALAAGHAGAPALAQSIQRGPAPQEVADRFVPDPPGIRIEDWVTGLEAPWALVFLPDGRALVTERAGRIRLIESGTLAAQPVATIAVSETNEGGLKGLAVHPRFPAQPFIFVMATVRVDGKRVNRVIRLKFDGASAAVDRVIVDRIPAGPSHNGGRIVFGPNGLLHIGTGDAEMPALSQDRMSLAGKVLRVTPEGAPARGNLRRASPVFTWGHRNVQGFAWHPEFGHLFASEHGPTGEDGLAAHDEINLIRPGRNYGWPLVVGAPNRRGLTDPLISWTSRTTPPSGMAFWRGDLFVATLGSESLVRVRLDLTPDGYRVTAIERWFHDGGENSVGRYGRLRDAVVGPDGALYVLNNKLDSDWDTSTGDDRILRISAAR